MRSFGIIILLSGLLLVVAVFALGTAFWSDPSPSGNGQAAGAFVFLVIGVPALGFCIVTTVLGTVMAVFCGHTTSPAPGPGGYTPVTIAPWHRAVSITGFWVAVLWTVPWGFLATVALITSDGTNLAHALLAWAVIALPAFIAHTTFKPAR